MRIPHRLLAATVLALLVAACTSEPVGPSVTDLGQVMPGPEDAPPGVRYAERLSGPVDLEAFRGDPAGRDAMQAAGFRSAWTALFADPALLEFFTLSRPDAGPPKHAKLLTVTAALFSDAAGAGQALRFFEDEALSQFSEAEGEGNSTTFRVRGSRDGDPVSELGGVAGAIVVLVHAQGAIPSDEVTAMFDEALAAARNQVA